MGYSSTAVFDMDSKLRNFGLKAETIHEFLIQLEEEFNNMIGSVEKYGGFYIGRYETGNLSKKMVVVNRENRDIGNQTWYTMYERCKNLKNQNTNIETGMIWGSQWDRTLIWLTESGNKTKEEICDSTTWGNYNSSVLDAMEGSGTIRPTGYNEAWKAANIYDLAGNVWECTTLANNSHYRVMCGGSISNNKVSDRWDNGGAVIPTYTSGSKRMPCNVIYKISATKIAINF